MEIMRLKRATTRAAPQAGSAPSLAGAASSKPRPRRPPSRRPRRAASSDPLAGPLFVLRQGTAVIALAKPAAPQCAGGKVTVADEFTIESRTVQAIRVRQQRHSHRYIFTVQLRLGSSLAGCRRL